MAREIMIVVFKQGKIQNANKNDLIELGIILPSLNLGGVGFGSVVSKAFFEAGHIGNLHLNDVADVAFIGGFDIENSTLERG